jgi:hypothetical protein
VSAPSIRRFHVSEIAWVIGEYGQTTFGVVRAVNNDGSGTIEVIDQDKPRLTGALRAFPAQETAPLTVNALTGGLL